MKKIIFGIVYLVSNFKRRDYYDRKNSITYIITTN